MDSSRRALIWFIIYSTAVLYVAGEEEIRLQELEGNTVTIHTGITVQIDATILWFLISENVDILIVNSLVFKGETNTDYNRDRFRDRLQLNRNSGSLTIRNISREDSGVYKLHIITGDLSVWSFSVDVYAMVSFPYITRLSVPDPSASASGSRYLVLCSAENQREMSLSWFKGRDILNQTRDSHLSVNLTLLLEVSDEDQDTYSCVTTNPVSNRSITLNIKEICSPGTGDDVERWGHVEFVIRSAFCVVVLVALIAVLVYHLKTL